MKHSFFRSSLLLTLVALCCASPAGAETALVGNPGLSGQTLDAEAVKAVLLGKRPTIGNVRAVIIIAKTGDAQDAFLKERVGMTGSQLQTHWRRLFMTGGGTAPKIVENEEEAGKLVAQTPGGITILDSAKAEGLVVLATQ